MEKKKNGKLIKLAPFKQSATAAAVAVAGALAAAAAAEGLERSVAAMEHLVLDQGGGTGDGGGIPDDLGKLTLGCLVFCVWIFIFVV